MMYAWIQDRNGWHRSTWPVEHYAAETGTGVELDGYHVDGVHLCRIETLATYRNGGEPPEEGADDGLLTRLGEWL